MSGSGDRPGSKGFEIPDLELPPPRQSQSSLRAAVPPASGSGPTTRSVQPDDDLEASLTPAAALDLELEGPISKAGSAAPRLGGGLDFDDGFQLDSVKAPPVQELAVAAEGRANWPSGASPEREHVVLDPLEIRLTASYGEAPTFVLLNVVYALRVAFRQRAITARLRGIEAELVLAESARDARLAVLAERVLPELEKSESFRRALAPLAEVESLKKSRGRELSAANAEQAAELGRLDAERAVYDTELTSEREASAELGKTLEAREQIFRRVEARHKRCFIEQRAIEQRAAQRVGPAGGEMPPELYAELAPLKAQAEALKPELDQARAASEATRAELEVRIQKQKELEATIREVERKKRLLEERYREQLGVREQGVGEVTSQRQALLADVGRAVLAARGGVSVDEKTLEALRQADASVLALVKQSELHLRALDASERDKVQSGFILLVVAIVLVAGYAVYRALA